MFDKVLTTPLGFIKKQKKIYRPSMTTVEFVKIGIPQQTCSRHLPNIFGYFSKLNIWEKNSYAQCICQSLGRISIFLNPLVSIVPFL